MFVSSMSLALAMTTNTFLVMGDMPYTPIDEINLAKGGKITKAIAATPHGFLLHLGDPVRLLARTSFCKQIKRY